MIGRKYTLEELARMGQAVEVQVVDGVPFVIDEIAFDSRDIHNPLSTVFIALRGEHRDGHHFLADAWEKGVRNFILTDVSFLPDGCNYILAEDCLKFLWAIADAHRRQFHVPVIGITGSNGKTTVKEWLTSILEPHFSVVKSPRSFNSAIGIPLSLLHIREDADWAIIEVGISKAGEMKPRAQLVRPDYGIFTHLGDAHAEGFSSPEEKAREKRNLFDGSTFFICLKKDDTGDNRNACMRVSFIQGDDALFECAAEKISGGWKLHIRWSDGEAQEMTLPVPGDAALENALLVIGAAAFITGLSRDYISRGIAELFPVSMRTEMVTDNPEITVINDTYNADRDSVWNAFSLLEAAGSQPGKMLILSDLEHQGRVQREIQNSVLAEAVRRFGADKVCVIGNVFHSIAGHFPGVRSFVSTADFIAEFRYSAFRHHTVLLKGARSYALEKVIPHLTRRAADTWFLVNMNALANNYKFFRARLPEKVKTMAMVKAFSYGSGSWEVAHRLELEGVNYLAVAYTAEGIALRTRGIRVPIMVMSPDESSVDQLFQFRLEPEIFSAEALLRYVRAGQLAGEPEYPVHLKVDTGMGRLGFDPEKPEALLHILREHPHLRVASVLSHLASADEPSLDEYTHRQAERFIAFAKQIEETTGQTTLKHLLNTAGTLRFPQYTFDMVRLGIGLYGVNPVTGMHDSLEEIGSLLSHITQIHEYPAGTFVGYGCSQVTERASRIATVPVGYADGIRRILGNGKISFLVRGTRVPTFGRICMDMLMLDVTDVPAAREGDEVVLLGSQGGARISARELAGACGTIAYEILTGISPRVPRVYVRE